VKRLLILGVVIVAAAVGVAIAVAATTGGENAATTRDATVSVKKLPNVGRVLVDAKGRALYRSDQEKRGMVLCDGACLSFWTPLTISGGAPKSGSLPGTLGIVRRPDGAKQVTYDGKLLYSFYLDKPGQVVGDGFEDAFGGRQLTWHVVHANGTTGSSAGGKSGGSGLPGY